ncbi:MAG: isoprenyl transferase [bacterium]|nr:isoprenyl transferase [bacterium]MDD3804637.1 isoprenyl transferase [bacterium]MDD4557386.1 isoprenyl transferase [bacterium]
MSIVGKLLSLFKHKSASSPELDNSMGSLDQSSLPAHVAVIMDGNGRWACKRGMPRSAGHAAGAETVREIIKACKDIGIKYLTLYSFSTENWKRPTEEVSILMELFERYMKAELAEMKAKGVRVRVIGDMDRLSASLAEVFRASMEATADNDSLILNLAVSYSGRDELRRAMGALAGDILDGRLKVEELTEAFISDRLDTAGQPDPDLLIRTGGDFRVSNFLLWQIAYTEIAVVDVLWPDFTREHLVKAIRDYQQRERRFGEVK